MNLWPHQELGIGATITAIERGIRTICLSSPTGAGKSTMLQKLCEWAVAREWTAAVFTNRKLLTTQLARGLHNAGIHVGVRAADFESWTDPYAPVQICSMPTEVHRVLRKRAKAMQRMATEEEAHADHSLFPANIVFIDEVHMCASSRMVEIAEEYKQKYGAYIVGITATPLGVSHMLEELIVAGNTSQLRACGALVAARCVEPMVLDLSKVYRSKHEIPTQAAMEKETKHIWTQHVVGSIYEHWKQQNPDGKQSLGFAPGVKESLGMAMEFHKHGVNAAHISGSGLFVDGKEYKSASQEARDDIFARSKSGEVPMIWNRFVLREAIDLPWIECLSLACPIRSLLSYVQTVGRGLRASPSTGKESCVIIDHAGNIRLHGSPNMDRDKEWRIYYHEREDKITADRVNSLRAENPDKNDPEPITCPKCGTMRRSGAECHHCGHSHPTSIRYILQEDGSLVPSSDSFMPRRQTKMFNNTAKKWEQCYFRMRNAKKTEPTFGQVRALFIHENHYCPPDGLPFMPKHNLDWTRKVKAVPMDRLYTKEDFQRKDK